MLGRHKKHRKTKIGGISGVPIFHSKRLKVRQMAIQYVSTGPTVSYSKYVSFSVAHFEQQHDHMSCYCKITVVIIFIVVYRHSFLLFFGVSMDSIVK